MNKGLEALERLKKVKVDKETPMSATFLAHDKRYVDDLLIIEKELKILEFVRRVLHVEAREYHLLDGTSEYVLKYDVYDRTITKEEFDLLKECEKI